MYIVWKKRKLHAHACSLCGDRRTVDRWALRPELVESRRQADGQPRQVYITRLPSIRSCCLASREVRRAWWQAVDLLLERYDPNDEHGLWEKLADRVAPVFDDQEAKRPAASSINPHAAAAVLGLTWPCEPAEAKSAFRQLAKQHHPDVGGEAAEFRRVREAYELIARLAS